MKGSLRGRSERRRRTKKLQAAVSMRVNQTGVSNQRLGAFAFRLQRSSKQSFALHARIVVAAATQQSSFKGEEFASSRLQSSSAGNRRCSRLGNSGTSNSNEALQRSTIALLCLSSCCLFTSRFFTLCFTVPACAPVVPSAPSSPFDAVAHRRHRSPSIARQTRALLTHSSSPFTAHRIQP